MSNNNNNRTFVIDGGLKKYGLTDEDGSVKKELMIKCLSLDWVIICHRNAEYVSNPMQVFVKWREIGSDKAAKLTTDASVRVFDDSRWILPRSINDYSIDAYGLLVDSRAVLQETTADSSTFAEIIACHRGTKEGVCTLHAILEIIAGVEYDVFLKSNGKGSTVPMIGDNAGALKYTREANVSNNQDVSIHQVQQDEAQQDAARSRRLSSHRLSLLEAQQDAARSRRLSLLERAGAEWRGEILPSG